MEALYFVPQYSPVILQFISVVLQVYIPPEESVTVAMQNNAPLAMFHMRVMESELQSLMGKRFWGTQGAEHTQTHFNTGNTAYKAPRNTHGYNLC